ncbi:MAG TPA: ribonuclease J, partial [Anaerolineaceae bacterium]|nr:ribonuclease J [Anaerolineaceae bacterium]
ERAGWTPSERVIEPAFEQVFTDAPGRIIIATFASLISRMQQVANAAERHGRKLAFVGTSMTDNMKMACKLGYLEFPENLVVSIDQALNMPDSEVALMCTGSQGEPSSILGRLSTGTNRLFDLKSGDTVVMSSHPIPGNEETVYRTVNRLLARGATVIYEAIAPVHVSGHASQEEMKLLIHLTRPKYVIPIHGELRQLKQHEMLARQVGIQAENIAVVQNGQVIEFANGEMSLGERLPGGYVFVDGSVVGDVSMSVMREREALARDGIVLVNVLLDRATGHLQREAEVITRGFSLNGGSDVLLASMRKRIQETVKNANGNLQNDVEQVVKSFLFTETRRRPMVFVTVSKN